VNVLRRLSTPAALLLLAFALTLTGVNYARHTSVIQAIQNVEKERKMQSLQASWVSEAITHTVTTPRQPEESVPAWIARHKESVDAMKAAFPPAQK